MSFWESVKRGVCIVIPVAMMAFFIFIHVEDILLVKAVQLDLEKALELPLDQTYRMDHIKTICDDNQKSKTKHEYEAKNSLYSQELALKVWKPIIHCLLSGCCTFNCRSFSSWTSLKL